MRNSDVRDFERDGEDGGHHRHKPDLEHGSRPHHREEGHSHHSTPVQRPSVEALAALLVRKGLCTEAELTEEESRLRRESGRSDDSQYVRIGKSDTHWEHEHRPQHPLRRYFAKYRWTRRLGTAIFGWKWKKMRKDPSPEGVH
jgi:hypothetical protein